MKKIKINFLIFIMVLLNYQLSGAFDDVKTHPQITDVAVQNSVLKSYLSQNLGSDFSKNEKILIDGMEIIEWLQKGSTAEDNPWCKASNHFHNPLATTWSAAGLSGYQGPVAVGINAYCTGFTPWIEKYSNLVWATGYTSLDGGTTNTINDMDWNDARTFYKTALTDASKTWRETNFAKFIPIVICSRQ